MENPATYPQPMRPKSNVGLLQDLSAAVNGQAAAATFACGGSVPIVEPAAMANSSHSEPIRTCSPITLRYDAGSDASGKSRISFPLPPNLKVSQSMLDGLISACQPATFGLEGKDVLDETYRKATSSILRHSRRISILMIGVSSNLSSRFFFPIRSPGAK